MRCPRCSSVELGVIDSRSDGNAIRRRRECEGCQFRFTTFEHIELMVPMVVKKDGRREPFDRAKLRAGMVRACEKTKVSMEIIDRTVEGIEARLQELGEKEIASRKLGDFVMEALRDIDKIAYMRFASVYQEFSDVSQFFEVLEGLRNYRRGGVTKKKGRKKGKTGEDVLEQY